MDFSKLPDVVAGAPKSTGTKPSLQLPIPSGVDYLAGMPSVEKRPPTPANVDINSLSPSELFDPSFFAKGVNVTYGSQKKGFAALPDVVIPDTELPWGRLTNDQKAEVTKYASANRPFRDFLVDHPSIPANKRSWFNDYYQYKMQGKQVPETPHPDPFATPNADVLNANLMSVTKKALTQSLPEAINTISPWVHAIESVPKQLLTDNSVYKTGQALANAFPYKDSIGKYLQEKSGIPYDPEASLGDYLKQIAAVNFPKGEGIIQTAENMGLNYLAGKTSYKDMLFANLQKGYNTIADIPEEAAGVMAEQKGGPGTWGYGAIGVALSKYHPEFFKSIVEISQGIKNALGETPDSVYGQIGDLGSIFIAAAIGGGELGEVAVLKGRTLLPRIVNSATKEGIIGGIYGGVTTGSLQGVALNAAMFGGGAAVFGAALSPEARAILLTKGMPEKWAMWLEQVRQPEVRRIVEAMRKGSGDIEGYTNSAILAHLETQRIFAKVNQVPLNTLLKNIEDVYFGNKGFDVSAPNFNPDEAMAAIRQARSFGAMDYQDALTAVERAKQAGVLREPPSPVEGQPFVQLPDQTPTMGGGYGEATRTLSDTAGDITPEMIDNQANGLAAFIRDYSEAQDQVLNELANKPTSAGGTPKPLTIAEAKARANLKQYGLKGEATGLEGSVPSGVPESQGATPFEPRVPGKGRPVSYEYPANPTPETSAPLFSEDAFPKQLFQVKDGAVVGKTTLLDNGKALISLFNGADMNTVAEEFFHAWQLTMPEAMQKEFKIAYGKNADDQWTAPELEKMARDFERYVVEGNSPTAHTNVAFANYRKFLATAYDSVNSSPLGMGIPQQTKDVFDTWIRNAYEHPDIIAGLKTQKERAADAEKVLAKYGVSAETKADISAKKAGMTEEQIASNDPKLNAEKYAAGLKDTIAQGKPGRIRGALSRNVLNTTLNPSGVTKVSGITATVGRALLGQINHSYEVLQVQFSKMSEALTKIPVETRYKLAAYTESETAKTVESGLAGLKDAGLEGFDNTFIAFKELQNEIKEYIKIIRDPKHGGNPESVLNLRENWLPHMWKNSDMALVMDAMRRSKVISSKFTHAQTISFMEGINGFEHNGKIVKLEPITDNPLDWYMLKLREVQKYHMAQQWIRFLDREELAEKVMTNFDSPTAIGKNGNELVKLNTSVGATYSMTSPVTSATGEFIPSRPKVVAQYYAAPEAARVLNNHLSPSLYNSVTFGNTAKFLRYSGNLMNQAQLGLSGFHAGFVTTEAMVSRFALGFQQLFEAGQRGRGLKNIALSPIAPARYAKLGYQMEKYFFEGKMGNMLTEDIRALSELMPEADMSIRMPEPFKNQASKALKEAVQTFRDARATGDKLTVATSALQAVGDAISTGLEFQAKPLMEWYVPRVKLGAFTDLVQFELSKLPDTATALEKTRVIQRAWDSIDNRFGQMVYDNLFWANTTKELGMLFTRSLGWNLGTFREMTGGIIDWGNAGLNFIKPKFGGAAVKFEVTPRMAYVASMPVMMGLAGATYQFLRTGQAPRMTSLEAFLADVYTPRTGNVSPTGEPERVLLPSYMKEVLHAFHGGVGNLPSNLGKMMSSKLHPLLQVGYDEFVTHKDYFGTHIFEDTDPGWKRVLDRVAYLVKTSFTPFSITNMQEYIKRGGSAGDFAQSFMGINPAPKYMTRSAAEELMYAQLDAASQKGGKSGETAARYSDKYRLRSQFLKAETQGQQQTVMNSARELYTSGGITLADFRDIVSSKKENEWERGLKRSTFIDTARVYDAASPEEKAKIKPILIRKSMNIGSTTKKQMLDYLPQADPVVQGLIKRFYRMK